MFECCRVWHAPLLETIGKRIWHAYFLGWPELCVVKLWRTLCHYFIFFSSKNPSAIMFQDMGRERPLPRSCTTWWREDLKCFINVWLTTLAGDRTWLLVSCLSPWTRKYQTSDRPALTTHDMTSLVATVDRFKVIVICTTIKWQSKLSVSLLKLWMRRWSLRSVSYAVSFLINWSKSPATRQPRSSISRRFSCSNSISSNKSLRGKMGTI